jgi:hypothetical protein
MEARFLMVYGAAENVGVYGAGALAFVDAGPGAGLIPCRVETVSEPGHGNRATGGRIVARLTAARGPYRRGETLTEPAWAIVPRAHVRRRGGRFTIDTRYRWA